MQLIFRWVYALGAPDEKRGGHGVFVHRLFGRARFPEIVGKHG